MYEYTLPMSSRPTQYCTRTFKLQVAEPMILVAMLPYDIPTLYFDDFIRNKENSMWNCAISAIQAQLDH